MSWNDSIIAEFRENGGRTANFGSRLVLLHTTGARTGEQRVSPMMYFAEPEGLFVVASKAGAPEHPAWFHNLRANPSVFVEQATDHGIESFDATASVVPDELRDRLWERFTVQAPGFAGYQEKTARTIPVVQLHRTEGGTE